MESSWHVVVGEQFTSAVTFEVATQDLFLPFLFLLLFYYCYCYHSG